MENNLDYPIDVVFLWVDGNDPNHQKKMEPYILDKSKVKNKEFRTRFDQVDEIEYAIDSVLKYASYVRNIFVLTDNQVPNFLKPENRTDKYRKVKIVDHKEVFIGYEEYLPTFNSISIETMITNISGLSEHFIYFNDDFLLINDTIQEDFFKDGKVVLRGEWRKYESDIWYKNAANSLRKLIGKKSKNEKHGFKRSQQIIAKRLGLKKRYYKFDHTPAPLKKSTFDSFFNENPDLKLTNAKYKFRNSQQFLLQGLANYLEIQTKKAILKDDYQLIYFGSYKKPLSWYKFNLWLSDNNKNKLFLCLQSLDQCPPNKLAYILNWLISKFEK